MRVLYHTEASAGGVGRHVTDLAEGMRRRGHDVHLVYSPTRMDNTFASEVGDMERSLRPISGYELPLRRMPCPGDVIAGYRLKHIVAERGPFDILHSHSTKAGWVSRIAIGRSVPQVYTPHAPMTLNPSLPAWQRGILAAIEKRLSLMTDAYIAVSPEESEHLAGLGIAHRKIRLIPNGLATRGASPSTRRDLRAELGIPPDKLCIGFVGRLVEQKNPALLLKAFGDLCNAGMTSVCLVMVGDGALRAGLGRMTATLGISQHVKWVATGIGRDYMQAFDIFALPSLYEGFPYVLLEAMDNGLPIVSNGVGGTSLLLGRSEAGLVVNVHDAEAFATALRHLVINPQLREHLRSRALVRVREFSVEKMLDDTELLYAALTTTSVVADLVGAVGR